MELFLVMMSSKIEKVCTGLMFLTLLSQMFCENKILIHVLLIAHLFFVYLVLSKPTCILIVSGMQRMTSDRKYQNLFFSQYTVIMSLNLLVYINRY